MRTRVLIGLAALIVIIASTSIYLAATRVTKPGDLGAQALVPSYGVIRFRPGETFTLDLALLDTVVTSLFGSSENITSIRLGGPQGDVDVLDWSVQVLTSEAEVAKPAAHLRRLAVNIRTPAAAKTLTEMEFAFADGTKKAFPFGALDLVPRDDTPYEEVVRHTGTSWEIYQWSDITLPSSPLPFKLAAMVIALDVSPADTPPRECALVAIDVGNPLLRPLDSSACLVKDVPAFELALQGSGNLDAACASDDRGLPLPIVFSSFSPQTTNTVNVGFQLEAAGPQPCALACLYIHPELTLDIDGQVIRVAANDCYTLTFVNVYSPEAAAFLKEWGK